MSVEVFANGPAATVTSGGTDAPAAGTSESLTVTATAAFPAASASATPPTVFHVCDVAAPSEIMRVTVAPGGTGAGQAWTVIRGAEGSTPVTHASGFAITQVITAGWLGSAATITAWTTGTQDISSETQGAIDGLSVAVAADTSYRFQAVIPFTCQATHAAYFTMDGPATSFFSATIRYLGGSEISAAESQVAVQTVIGTNTDCGSTVLTAGETYSAEIDGIATFTTAGDLIVNGASSANVASFTTQAGSILEARVVR